MARGEAVRAAIVDVLGRSPGLPVTLDTIMRETGFTKAQVQSCVNHLINEGKPVEKIVAGNTWTWRSVPSKNGVAKSEPVVIKPTAPIYEEVGRDGDGQPILRNEDGVLGRWIPL